MAPESPLHMEGTVGVAVTPAPSVLVTDAMGKPVYGTEVRFEVIDGGGSVSDGITQTGPDGRATVGSWTLGISSGTNTLAANVDGVDPIVFTATAAPGVAVGLVFAVPPANVVENLPIAPAIVVELQDQFGNRATTSHASITLSLAQGPSGATVSGVITVAATDGLAVFSNVVVSAPTLPTPQITSVTPGVLISGVATRIRGTSFGPTASQNIVSINGIPATMINASTTEINVIAPQFSPECLPTRNIQIIVKVEVPAFVVQLRASASGLNSALSQQFATSKAAGAAHPVRTAPQLPLAVGQSTVLTTSESARCVELPQTGGSYLVSVFSASTSFVSTVQYALRGQQSSLQFTPAIVGAVPLRAAREAPRSESQLSVSDVGHMRILQENARILRQNPHPMFSASGRAAMAARSAAGPPPPAAAPASVGTLGAINEFRYSFTSCGEGFVTLLGRTAWVGQHAIIVEDLETFGSPPLNGTVDQQYAEIGQEFDARSWPIIVQNFGNPLLVDAQMAQHGKVIMLFSNKVLASGSQAFVFSCDFFPRSMFPKSNEAPMFYARPPLVTGAGFFPPNTPDGWQWITRSTVIHETKHIASYAARISQSQLSGFEEIWLEEGGARTAEELFGRTFYGSFWKDNSNYLTFRCDLHPAEPACAGRPFAMPKHFGATISPPALYDFMDRSETRSVLCIDQPCLDTSFYGSAWSMIRWAVDNYALSEQQALSALTQTSALSGAASIQALAGGLSWPTIMGEWSLMLATDDLSGFTPANPRLRMLSWNLRAVFQGIHDEFPTVFPKAYPLTPRNVTFGDFLSPVISLIDGGFSLYELAGTQSGSQVIELQGSNGGPPPGTLRMAIVRVQ